MVSIINKNDYELFAKSCEATMLRGRSSVIFMFFWGGFICMFAEMLILIFNRLGFGRQESVIYLNIALILISFTLTLLGAFQKMGRFAVAFIFITPFWLANAVLCCALENRAEGFIFGVCGKMFEIVGPVLVCEVIAFILCGGFLYAFSFL